MDEQAKLLLIDGNSIAFRAFYALYQQVERFKNADGLHTSAMFGFKNMLDVVLDRYQPTHVLVAFDAGKKTFRTQKYTDYKGGRKKTPQELSEQFPYLKEMLNYMGLATYELKNYEADDIIGTMAHSAKQAGMPTVILTGDRDLTQLADDLVTVAVTKSGVNQIEDYTPAHVKEKLGLTPAQIIDLKALMGDTSDNYPGVTKVGEKTALKLLHEYGSLDNLYANVEAMKKSKLKEHLIEDKDVAFMCQDLATIRMDAPLTIDLAATKRTEGDQEQLANFYRQMQFKQFLAQLEPKEFTPKPLAVTPVATAAEVNAIDDHPDEIQFYLQLADANYHTAEMVGFAIKVADKIYTSSDANLLQQAPFKQWLESDAVTVDVFNTKASVVALRRLAIKLSNVNFDMLLVSYLLDTTENSGDVGALAHLHQYYNVATDESVFGKGKKWQVPADAKLFDHLAHKVTAIAALKPQLEKRLADHHQTKLYTSVERPLAFVLAQMEMTGIKLEQTRLQAMGQKLNERVSQLQEEIWQLAGSEFNLNSPKQLGVVLFEDLKLPVVKKTKTGYSTAVGVLEKLVGTHPIIEKLLLYRQLSKLASTYLTGLVKAQNPNDGKIHTRYLQTLTQTGRLSSVDPNLQNIPVRLEEGRKIRQAFVPSSPDAVLLSADYSQIELRVLAHISGDKNMQQAFIDNEDIHAETARKIYGLQPDEEVTYEMRRHAKAVNFGIVYGISAYGLAQSIGVSRKQAQRFIDAYLAAYPQVHEYMDSIVATARKQGYVETLLHRRRYLPDINAKSFNLRTFAERTALNTPIQGSAADIIKVAMINVAKQLDAKNLRTKMLLQVHDELIFEVPNDELDQVKQLVATTMDSAIKLAVPLKVSVGAGKTWYDIKK